MINSIVINQYLADLLKKTLDEDVVAIVLSMTIGATKLLSFQQKNLFKVTGMSHVLVASGSNVGLVLWLVNIVLSSFKLQKSIKEGLAIWAIVCYWGIVGLDPSITRASIMAIYSRLSTILNRQYQPLSGLLFSCLVIIFIWPAMVGTISFQFSVLASLGIIIFSKGGGWFESLWLFTNHSQSRPVRPSKSLYEYLQKVVWQNVGIEFKSTVVTSISAQILVLPLSWYYFESFSISSIFINIFLLSLFNLLALASWLLLLLSPFLLMGYSRVFYVGLTQIFLVYYQLCLSCLTWFANHLVWTLDSRLSIEWVFLWWLMLLLMYLGSVIIRRVSRYRTQKI